jgi:hypothetical protein
MPEPSVIAPLPRPSAPWVPSWIRSRRRLILAAIILTAGAIALGWPWLVAAGVAPLLLAAAPCLAMCALGLCMRGMSGNACSTSTARASNAQSPQAGKEPTNA